MLGYQGYPPLEEVGVLDEVRGAGWDIAPRPDGSAVAIAVEVGILLGALARDLPVEYEHSVVELVRDGEGRVTGVVAEGPGGRTTFESDLVVACDGVGSPVRSMAGFQANIEPLAEASLTFMSPAPITTSFNMAYFADGGHIGVLGWPQGSAGWRSVEKVGAEAALAPGLEAIKRMWSELLPDAAPGVEALTSLDQVRYGEPQLLTCPEWWKPGRGHHRRLGPLLRPRDRRQLRAGARRRARARPGRAAEPGRPRRRLPQLRALAGAADPPVRGHRPGTRAHGRRRRPGSPRGALAAAGVGPRPAPRRATR